MIHSIRTINPLANTIHLSPIAIGKNTTRVSRYLWDTLKSHLFCGGVGGPKEIVGNSKLEEAYKMGKQV